MVLLLLDMSAAFDTVDHELLLQRMFKRFGIDGQALKWFQSYLQNRTQSVVIDGVKSISGRRERGRGNANTSSVPIRDADFVGGKTF